MKTDGTFELAGQKAVRPDAAVRALQGTVPPLRPHARHINSI